MTHISKTERKINARFIKNKENRILIEFADPAYVKAESVLFDPRNNSVHAVLHEGVFLVDHVAADII